MRTEYMTCNYSKYKWESWWPKSA